MTVPVAVPPRGKVPLASALIGAEAVAAPVSGRVPLAGPLTLTLPVAAASVMSRTPLAVPVMPPPDGAWFSRSSSMV